MNGYGEQLPTASYQPQVEPALSSFSHGAFGEISGIAPPPGYVPPPPGYVPQSLPVENVTSLRPSSTPAVISAAPTTYRSRGRKVTPRSSSNQKPLNPTNAASNGDSSERQSTSSVKTPAQLMAERVAASAVTVTKTNPSLNINTTVTKPSGSVPKPGTVTSTSVAPARSKQKRPKKYLRSVGGKVWEDKSLLEWNPDDFRVFVGDLGNDVTEEVLQRHFSVYSSLNRVHVVRDKRTGKTKGYGFMSFSDSDDYVRAIREMSGKYVGSRPIKLKKSQWKERQLGVVRKKQKERNAMGML